MMRILSLFILMLCSQTALAHADYIQGHIVQIDRAQGELVITLCAEGCTGSKPCALKGQDLAVDLGEGKVGRRVTVLASWLPRCLSEGMMIFARGDFVKDDTTRFEAAQVFPQKGRGSKDETGVRSRFRHHRGQSQVHDGE